MPVSVVARITAKEGRRDDVVAILSRMVTATESEPGTLAYSMHADNAEPETVWFFEVYTDEAALAAHGGSDTMKAVGAELRDLVASRPEVHVCTPLGAKGGSLPS